MLERTYADNATPATNSVAIANLVRLSLLREDLSYLERTEQGLPCAVLAVAQDLPQKTVSLVCQGLSCLSPARTSAQLWEQIQQSQKRG